MLYTCWDPSMFTLIKYIILPRQLHNTGDVRLRKRTSPVLV